VELVTRARDQLSQLYGESGLADSSNARSSESKPAEINSLRAKKQDILNDLRRQYEQLKSTWGGDRGYDSWFNRPLNNARLNDVDTYYALVPAFRRMWELNNGDWKKFYGEAEALGKLHEEERHRKLRELGAK
jgi:predicted aminopeptidase